ncbi:MAG: aspartate kinase, partial [Saprospiraceae bacterium]
MEVFKFGGVSIKDAVSVRNVTDILRNYRNKPLVVVLSAMGKTTDALEAIMDNCFYGNGTPLKCLNEIKQQHLIIVNQLIDDNRNEVY